MMPGTARTSVIMLACKKEEKLQEETMLSPQNGRNSGEKVPGRRRKI